MKMALDIIFTLIEGCCILYMVKNETINKTRQMLFLIFFVAVFSGLTFIFTLSDIELKALFSYGVPILLAVFILGFSIKKSVLYTGICTSLLIFSELIITQIGVIFHITPGTEEAFSIPIIHIVVSKIIYITLLFNVQKIISDINMKKYNLKLFLIFIFSNIGYMVVGICIYANIVYVQNTVYSNVFLLCSTIMLIALVTNLIFSNKYSEIENKEYEQRMAIYELEIQTRYYEEKLKEEERIKQIYHDMKNHLLLMEDKNIEDSREICNIKKNIMRYEAYYRTGNKFLDIILKDKIEKACEDSIKVEDNIDLSGMDFIDPFDISTIFGNMLDNAIEACRSIVEIEKRRITILAKRENDFLVIREKNNKENIDKIIPPKKVIHGYGLLNITNAVHKYEGEVDINESKNEFVINIIIPIKKERGN